MASTKLVLDQRRARKDGTYPLVLRVTHKTKTFSLPLGSSISTIYWNANSNKVKQNCPIYKPLDELIRQKELDVRKASLKLEQRGLPYKITDLQQLLSTKSLEGISFNQYALECVEQMKIAGRIGNSLTYEQSLNSLLKFSNKELQFTDINFKYLTEYDTFMRSKGIKVNTIASYLRGVRAIFNRAINEDITNIDNYPFRKFKFRTEATPSRAVSIEKISNLFNHKLKINTKLYHYQNYFILMFCLIGINFADLCTLNKSNLVDGRLHYRRKKTKRLYSILLHPMALKIIQQYEGNSCKYLLPILPDEEMEPIKFKKVMMDKLKLMNKALKRLSKASICESISTYTSRYSWANIAKEIGTPKEVIAEALGHSYGNAITGIYLDSFDKKVMDKANFDVINVVFSDNIGEINEKHNI